MNNQQLTMEQQKV